MLKSVVLLFQQSQSKNGWLQLRYDLKKSWGHLLYLAFGAPFTLGEADFHIIKDRETLRRSHNNLNTTHKNMGLTMSFSESTGLCNVCVTI
jgi:hypothetical protein